MDFMDFGRRAHFSLLHKMNHKLHNLKRYPLISSQISRMEVHQCVTGVSAQGITKLKPRLSSLEALGKNLLPSCSNCWQNSVPGFCRTEVPVSLQAVCQGPPLASRGCLHFLPFVPLHLPSQHRESPPCWLTLLHAESPLPGRTLSLLRAYLIRSCLPKIVSLS